MEQDWKPDDRAVRKIDEIRFACVDWRLANAAREALLHGLNHPCAGPRMQRILLEKTEETPS